MTIGVTVEMLASLATWANTAVSSSWLSSRSPSSNSLSRGTDSTRESMSSLRRLLGMVDRGRSCLSTQPHDAIIKPRVVRLNGRQTLRRSLSLTQELAEDNDV